MLAKVELMRVGVHQIRVSPSWIDSIVAFLKEGMLPMDRGGGGRENTKKSSPLLAVQGAEVV